MTTPILALTLGMLAITSAAVPALAAASDYPLPPLRERMGGALFRGHSILRIPREGVELRSDTLIQVDHLVLEGPIVTRGHALRINTRKLEFSDGGRITGFDGVPAGEQALVPPPVPGTGSNPDQHAASGMQGYDGINGMSAPGAIDIFAAQVVGIPRIDGRGQKGGRGGRGGQGQKGAVGHKGANARCSCGIPIRDDPAGRGGMGGKGGRGGLGGQGGRGGDAIRVTLLGAYSGGESPDFSEVVSEPGPGGEGGTPGDMGPGGNGGPGGEGCSDSLNLILFDCDIDQPAGGIGPANSATGENHGTGPAGDAGPGFTYSDDDFFRSDDTPGRFARTFDSLETHRHQVDLRWTAFHWSRQWLILLQDSIRLMTDLELTRAQIDRLPSLAPVLRSASRANTARIADAWRLHFLLPLEETLDELGFDPKIVDRLDQGRRIHTALSNLHGTGAAPDDAAIRSLDDAYRDAKYLVEDDLERAARECQRYQTALVSELEALFGRTSYFHIPVCQNPVALLENPASTIRLRPALEPLIRSAPSAAPSTLGTGQSLAIENQAPLADSELAFVMPESLRIRASTRGWLDWLVPAAHASDTDEDFAVIFFDGRWLTPRLARHSTPRPEAAIGTAGVFELLQAPAESPAADLNEVQVRLRALSLIFGSEF